MLHVHTKRRESIRGLQARYRQHDHILKRTFADEEIPEVAIPNRTQIDRDDRRVGRQ